MARAPCTTRFDSDRRSQLQTAPVQTLDDGVIVGRPGPGTAGARLEGRPWLELDLLFSTRSERSFASAQAPFIERDNQHREDDHQGRQDNPNKTFVHHAPQEQPDP